MAGDFRRTICVDFDGVIHSYTSGWKGVDIIPDPPVEGAIEWLQEMVKHFQVAIFSSRSSNGGAIIAMRVYLEKHGLPRDVLRKINFPTTKPAAHLSIDDRGFCFTGAFPGADEISAFKPWYK